MLNWMEPHPPERNAIEWNFSELDAVLNLPTAFKTALYAAFFNSMIDWTESFYWAQCCIEWNTSSELNAVLNRNPSMSSMLLNGTSVSLMLYWIIPLSSLSLNHHWSHCCTIEWKPITEIFMILNETLMNSMFELPTELNVMEWNISELKAALNHPNECNVIDWNINLLNAV